MLRQQALHTFCFFNDTATTEIYTLSLHDALPICWPRMLHSPPRGTPGIQAQAGPKAGRGSVHSFLQEWPPNRQLDRKSTRLNSSHANISYAVFCLKKKN